MYSPVDTLQLAKILTTRIQNSLVVWDFHSRPPKLARYYQRLIGV